MHRPGVRRRTAVQQAIINIDPLAGCRLLPGARVRRPVADATIGAIHHFRAWGAGGRAIRQRTEAHPSGPVKGTRRRRLRIRGDSLIVVPIRFKLLIHVATAVQL